MKSIFCSELLAAVLAVMMFAVEAPAQTSTPAQPASEYSLDTFLTAVAAQNGNFRAISSSKEAAQARRVAGDIELSPILTATARKIDDKKPQILGAFSLTGSQVEEYSLGLSKKFSTGTTAAVTASVNETSTTFQTFGPPTTSSVTNAFGALGISLSQSLWKDFFGNGTELRREREAIIEKTETQGLDLQARQVLIDAEAIFWEHMYLKEEIRQGRQSLARAKRLETWVKSRASNGIGDRADVLNASGLVANRELQLIISEDEFKASNEKIRNLLEMTDAQALPELSGNLSGPRALQTLVDGNILQERQEKSSAQQQSEIVRLDAYLSVLQAQARAIQAREVNEGLKPDLKLEGAYKTNSVDTSKSGALSDISRTNLPTTMVGISFVYLLDFGVKDAGRRAAKLESMSADQKRGRALLESSTGWSELQRRHGEMTKKIAAAERASQLQGQKADAERDRYSKGRSTTSTVILAEQDASESELTLTRLRTEQRKLESQGRMFISISNDMIAAQGAQ